MFLDLRLAVRSIVRAPLTAVGAILTLAVGVGVALTALGTLDGFFWRPLPYPGVDRLVGIARTDPPLSLRWPEADIGTIEMVRARMPALDDVAAAHEQGVRIELASGTVVRQATWTTPNAFTMLGTPPLLGRVPRAARGDDGAGEVAVGEQFWRQYLGARPDVIGATLVVDGAIATIVGVMPDGFQFHFNSDLWLALDWNALHYTPEERLITIGRLREGATLGEARLQAAALAPQLPTYQGYESRYTLFVHDEMIIRNAIPKPLFRLVLGVALFVLVVGCVNVANLLLVRTLTHRGELAIRAALGGGTAALIRPGLAYATVIAGAGGGLGILGAVVANTWLAGRMSTVLPAWAIFRLDARFTMTAVLAVALVVLVTAVPAVRLSRRTDVMGLISASTQSMPLHVSRLSRSALAAQVAIMLAVTVGAVQVLRSYGEISRVDPGFLAHTILAADIRTPDGALSSPEWRAGLAEIAARLEAVPDIAGVTHRWYVQRTTQWDRRGDAGLDSVALSTGAVPRRSAGLIGEPGALAMNDSIYLDTAPTKRVAYRVSGPTMAYAVGETYFDVTGIGLQAGRAFTRTDNVGGAPVGILSRALAAALWPDQSAVGHRFKLGPGGPWVDVVGVANDVRVVTASMWEGTLIKPEYTLYLPHAQARAFSPQLLVRQAAHGGDGRSPLSLSALVTRAVAESPVRLELARVRSFDTDLGAIANERRVMALILGGCAAAVLLLGAFGLFAMMAFYAAARVSEFGIRAALGASTLDIARQFLRALQPVLIRGAIGGALLTLVGSHLLGAFVSPRGGSLLVALPLTIIILTMTLAAACARPLWRAARVAPIVALRNAQAP